MSAPADYDEGLVSNIYTVFEVKDENELLPEYLMLWFSRPEFDRYARFKSHGSVREIMDWDEMCKVELPVPSIDKQRSIVKAYQTITERIELKRRINDNLEATAQAVFQEQFASFYGADELPDGYRIINLDNLCTVKGGKRLPADCKLLDTPTDHPYIRVRDVGSNRYVCLTNQFQYIDEETYSAISRYIVNTGDIVISIVGTIGLLGKIHSSLDKANLTENCVKLANIHTVTSDYLYYTLCYKKQIKEIDLLSWIWQNALSHDTERGMGMYQGVNASEGIGIGTVMVAVDPDLTFEPHEVADSAAEKERYQTALSVFLFGLHEFHVVVAQERNRNPPGKLNLRFGGNHSALSALSTPR